MNTQKFLVSGLFGAVVSFFAGYLLYGVLLMDFFSNNVGSATGVMRAPTDMIWWSLVVGCLFMGFTYSYVYNRFGNINTVSAGASAGAVLGLLITAGFDFIMYANTNISNLTGTFADIVAGAVLGAITGAAVGMANGWGNKKVAV
ncbi:MAG: hypothetical protein JWQ78_710 [Sediminibacterium sp.]|nr:hypothetical protein [Sediminibacterium sp.]